MVLFRYRRPGHASEGSVTTERSGNSRKSDNSSSSRPHGIPEALSFDKIIDGGTCPVRTSFDEPTHDTDTVLACDDARVHGLFGLRRA